MHESAKRWMVPAVLGVTVFAVAGAAWFGLSRHSGGSAAGSTQQDAAKAQEAATLSFANTGNTWLPATPLTVTVPAKNQIAAVEIADAAGTQVLGQYSTDLRTWQSIGHLEAGAAYQATVMTRDSSGNLVGTQRVNFTTATPSTTFKSPQIAPANNSTVGVGQPVVLQFPQNVTNKAAVEQSLTVHSNPPQAGHWSWLSDKRVDYRPENYWTPGTVVTVGMNFNGLDIGGGLYGLTDKTLNFTIGRDQETIVDLKSDHASVYQDGQLTHTFAVTGGKPGLDTYSGTYAVIEKQPDIEMKSSTVGLGQEYDVPHVLWTVHLTYSGTYIHAAPWSVYAQGSHNVSHGCIGTSNSSAQWFFNATIPGDIVKVINTPRNVAAGNGFADWQESWQQWLAGSAAI